VQAATENREQGQGEALEGGLWSCEEGETTEAKGAEGRAALVKEDNDALTDVLEAEGCWRDRTASVGVE
jgi:hypothetical protein